MKNFAFESTGDPEKDAEIAMAIRRRLRNESEGMCPNGCAPVVWSDPHNQDCPKCGFHGQHNVPYGGLSLR